MTSDSAANGVSAAANTNPNENINPNTNTNSNTNPNTNSNTNSNNNTNTNTNPNTTSNTNDDCTLDAILVRIGQFGRFQLFNYMLLCIPMIFNALFSVSYVFTASSVVHRCNITLCDSVESDYSESWLNFTIPMKGSNLEQCQRYVYKDVFERTEPASQFCKEEYFDRNQTEFCGNDFKFRDTEVTIANEFSFFCREAWKLNMVGTINNVGQFVGIPLGGFFADRYGRRTMLAVGGFLSALMGILRSLATNYYMFLSFEFLDMVVGSTLFPTAFLLAIELVGPKRRVAAATIITIFYALGEALLGALAQQFQHWRVLLRIIYVPATIQLLFLFILPESVRWLLSQQKWEKAIRVLQQAARINRRDVPKADLQCLVDEHQQKLAHAHEGQYPIMAALKLFRWRISNCCLCWFTHTLVALGLSITSVTLAGNKYENFMLNGVVQVPGLLLPLFIMDRFGRRYALFASMSVCAICMALTAILGHFYPGNHGIELALFLVGKLAITCSFQILYFFTSEIFPTNVRNSLLSFCSMVGRIGSMLAPQVPLLAAYYVYAPQVLFASFALISGALTLTFPETADKVLPTTLQEAENFNGKGNNGSNAA